MCSANTQLPTVASIYRRRIESLLADGKRHIVGIVGPPGAGKSTLSEALNQAFSAVSQILPMDGYHLANKELLRLGRNQRKGAPDTFDSGGFVDLLRRVRAQSPDEVLYAPEFRREIEEPIAGAIPINADRRLLIAEGNYLMLPDGHWAHVMGLLDEVWYVDVDDELRLARLVARHEHFGRSHQAAVDWVHATDEPNARLIAAQKHRADVLFRWDPLPQ
jgi:pantothenate kinase